MSLNKLFVELKAQGNWGHAGRPGKRGGSLPKGGGGSGMSNYVSVTGNDLKVGDEVYERKGGKVSDVGKVIQDFIGENPGEVGKPIVIIKWVNGAARRYLKDQVASQVEGLSKKG